MSGTPISVVDCETTGLGRSDRIVELAIVTMVAETGEVLEEFETLVNPERDVGPVHIHGVTAEMAGWAPTFEEVAPVVASRLHRSTIVAHNLNFDLRMLQQEFSRSNRTIDWGVGICTLRLTGLRLGHAARAFGVPMGGHHRALSDARAAASLLWRLGDWPIGTPCVFDGGVGRTSCRTLRREAFGAPIDLPLRRWIRAACVPSSAEACVEYFDLLEHALADLHLSDEEAEELRGLQDRVGLRASQVRSMHSAYFESLCQAALADGVITDRERSVLRSVAASLGIPEQQIPETSRTVIPGPRSLPSGTRICFTGAAVGADGGPILREWLEGVAASRGLQPVAAVTKKGCDLLVVADLATQSSKARKAREYAIPVIDVSEYLRLLEADPGAL